MNAMRFERIELKNWKNFPSVDVKLASRVFLIGPNAIGKSNFLDAFRFLRDLVVEGGGLAQALKSRGGLGRVRSLHAHRDPEVSLKTTVLNPTSGARWCYEVAFTHETRNGHVPVVALERVTAIEPGGSRLLLDRPNDSDRGDLKARTQVAIQQAPANKAFRELADFLASVSYLHLVPQLLREEAPPPAERLTADPYGRDLLGIIRDTNPRARNERLKLINSVLKTVVPDFLELKMQPDSRGRPHLVVKFEHWRRYGARQDEVQFSDGTLRFIGFLWALQDKAGPLLLEEPELSLHPAIVQSLAPFIHKAQVAGGGRQVIVSTHSPDLLSDEGIAPEEVLLVRPGTRTGGSGIIVGADDEAILQLMESGIPASEAALPRTNPQQALNFGMLFP
jgi:predicted ATPase